MEGGNPVAAFSYLIGSYRQKRARSFSSMCTERIKDHSHKRLQRKFQFVNNFFSLFLRESSNMSTQAQRGQGFCTPGTCSEHKALSNLIEFPSYLPALDKQLD